MIPKPILFTKVNPEPTNSLGAERAIIAEYCGESPTTTIPQKIRKNKKTVNGVQNIIGDIKQQILESKS